MVVSLHGPQHGASQCSPVASSIFGPGLCAATIAATLEVQCDCEEVARLEAWPLPRQVPRRSWLKSWARQSTPTFYTHLGSVDVPVVRAAHEPSSILIIS